MRSPAHRWRFRWYDWLLIALLAGFCIFVAYRLAFLNYKWNWGVIPTYLVRFDEESGRWLPNLLLQGLFTTIKLSFWGALVAAVVGLVMGCCGFPTGCFSN